MENIEETLFVLDKGRGICSSGHAGTGRSVGNNTCIQPIRLASYPEARHLSDENMTVVHQGEATTKCLLLISSTRLSNLFMNPISYPIRTLSCSVPLQLWQNCLLALLGAIMAFVILCLGWWGEPVRQFFTASDSRYSHYPLHERRYPYRQSAHLCVLSCVTACCSHQAGLAEQCSFCVAFCSASSFCASS